ncbi:MULTISPECIES: hypothetical protein [Asticcacaulis]|uniref:hypothetical protein n=1 Tax=Asticcacaulis TaxID=76890 RepID=UPI001AE341C1|nr:MULTISPECIES: hypothetical protein [Asticcacaulis]MBP2160450.1 hypothetical protein [Asticcacaulis solisilvae]MDR6801495.1 hypothetical protein [Asticcacaulis sp. BE141]
MKVVALSLLATSLLAFPAQANDLLKKLADVAGATADVNSARKIATLVSDNGDYDTYGSWQFKVDDVLIGADGEWQSVIGVRNLQDYRMGMVVSEIKAALITADGETLQNWGELYRASVSGGGAGLEKLPGTLWIEPGESARFRLRFSGSRGIKPVRIRVESTGATAQSRTFNLN